MRSEAEPSGRSRLVAVILQRAATTRDSPLAHPWATGRHGHYQHPGVLRAADLLDAVEHDSDGSLTGAGRSQLTSGP
jgi:hypothetical protein